MPRLTIISNSDPLAIHWLEGFKQYASISHDGLDALLLSTLSAAILRVQEYADRALIECRVRQTATSDSAGKIRLYLGGGKDVSVTSADGAATVQEVRNSGDSVWISPRGADACVEFTTAPSGAWREQARMTVYRYATAVYDGESPDVCNSILNEVL